MGYCSRQTGYIHPSKRIKINSYQAVKKEDGAKENAEDEEGEEKEEMEEEEEGEEKEEMEEEEEEQDQEAEEGANWLSYIRWKVQQAYKVSCSLDQEK